MQDMMIFIQVMSQRICSVNSRDEAKGTMIYTIDSNCTWQKRCALDLETNKTTSIIGGISYDVVIVK